MALTELQKDGYPIIARYDGSWVETRVFTTTDILDAHSVLRSDFASPLGFSVTTSPLRVKDIVCRRRSQKDSATGLLVWEVEITATDLATILSGNGDQSELEDIETTATAEYDSAGKLNFLETETRVTNITVVNQSDLDQASSERTKIGLVNSSDNNPFQGAIDGQWRCSNVKGSRGGAGDSLNRLKLVYIYERAPRDDSGNYQTWADWGAAQSPAVTFNTGDISPLRL